MRRNNILKDIDIRFEELSEASGSSSNTNLSKAVEDGNIFVAHITRCGNECETKRKPSKTAT